MLFKNSDWNIENGPECCVEVIQTWRSCKSLSSMERVVTCSSNFFSCYVRSKSFLFIFLGCTGHMFTKQHLKIPKPITDTSLTRWLMTCHSVQSLWMSRVNVESSSSSCALRVRCIPCSLVLKVELVPPSLLRSSNVPSSFWSVFQCLSWQSISVHPLYVL